MKRVPTHQRLRELFDYDEETGVLTWIKSATERHNVNIGKRAGRLHSNGYRRVQIGHQVFLEHRIIWAWMNDEAPPASIDHINRNRADNRWCNLRAATLQQQAWNALAKASNSCGLRGVYFARDRNRWVAEIRINGKMVRLGVFQTKEEAAAAYQGAGRVTRGEFFPA